MEWWGNSAMLGDGGAPFLDQFPGAYRAYSLQLLQTGVPHVAQVRRSSDNTLRNVSATEITDGTLTSWVGAGNGFVTRLYDQRFLTSNPGDAAAQTDPARQPQIVTAGVLVTTNGKPAMRFNGTNSYLLIQPAGNIAMNALNVSVVAKADVAAASLIFGVADPNRIFVPIISSTPSAMNVGYAGANFAFVFGSAGITDQVLVQLNAGATQANAWRNGVVSTPVASSSAIETFGASGLGIGATFKNSVPGSVFWNGTFQELIIYSSDKTADVAAHAANINSRYNIF
jgi:hypothetical protein